MSVAQLGVADLAASISISGRASRYFLCGPERGALQGQPLPLDRNGALWNSRTHTHTHPRPRFTNNGLHAGRELETGRGRLKIYPASPDIGRHPATGALVDHPTIREVVGVMIPEVEGMVLTTGGK